MASYSEYTQKATATVKYSFVCEKCKKDSGVLTHTISGEATKKTKLHGKLSFEQQAELAEKAKENLHKEIELEKSGKAVCRMEDKCPHCQQSQTWRTKGYLLSKIGICTSWLVLVGLLALGMWGTGGGKTAIGILKLFAVVCCVILAPGIIRLIKDQFVKDKQQPVIYWDTLFSGDYEIQVNKDSELCSTTNISEEKTITVSEKGGATANSEESASSSRLKTKGFSAPTDLD